MSSLTGHVYVADDGRAWDLDLGLRIDPDGTETPEAEWSAEEQAIVAAWRKTAAARDWQSDIAAWIAVLTDLRGDADTDRIIARGGRGDVEAWALGRQARATAFAGTSPDLTALRDEVVDAARKDAELAGQVAELLAWREQVDQALCALIDQVTWVGRLLTQER